jgi:site-specific recombinase XerD
LLSVSVSGWDSVIATKNRRPKPPGCGRENRDVSRQEKPFKSLTFLGLSEAARMAQMPAPLLTLEELAGRAQDFARATRAPATLRAYRADWTDFTTWCGAAGQTALPASPQTVGLYLAARSERLKVASLRRRLSAIAVAHKLAGLHLDLKHPAVSEVLAGIRRQLGSRSVAKTALSPDDLRRVLQKLPHTLAGTRDRALLLVGFAGAFRRSELAALDLVDIKLNTQGAAILIRRSKTDQAGIGETIGIPRSRRVTCPVAALEQWISALVAVNRPVVAVGPGEIAAEPLFRVIWKGSRLGERLTGDGVSRIIKRAVARVGLDPALYAGHSLRSGFCTAAAAGGADLALIMQQSRHRSVEVARRYVQAGKIFSNPASKAVGL